MTTPMRPSAEDIRKLQEAQCYMKAGHYVEALAFCTQFAYSLVQKAEPGLNPNSDIFQDAVIAMSSHVYNAEKAKLGLSTKTKMIPKAAIKRSVQ